MDHVLCSVCQVDDCSWQATHLVPLWPAPQHQLLVLWLHIWTCLCFNDSYRLITDFSRDRLELVLNHISRSQIFKITGAVRLLDVWVHHFKIIPPFHNCRFHCHCFRNDFIPLPQSLLFHDFIVEVYREFLGLHVLVFVPACCVTCGSLYKQMSGQFSSIKTNSLKCQRAKSLNAFVEM